MSKEFRPSIETRLTEKELTDLQSEMSGELVEAIGRKTPDDIARYQETILDAMSALESQGATPGIAVGSLAPPFTLPDLRGSSVSLESRLSGGPVVLTFYRGSWCPICSMQLRALQAVVGELRDLGASLIAVSPQSPDTSLAFVEEASIDFDVLTDADQAIASRYRVLFTLPDQLRPIYHDMGMAPDRHNADGSWQLPVPATFVIDRTGVVRSRHVDPRYWERMRPDEIRDALKLLD